MFGNLLRSFVSKKTNGAVDTQELAQQEEETDDEYKQRLGKGIGAAVAAGTGAMSSDGSNPFSHGLQAGAIAEKLKQYAFPVLGGIALLMVGKSLLNRKKR